MENQLDIGTIDAAIQGRYDLYGPAHKCLRHVHAVMLPRLARADWAVDQGSLLAELRQHSAMNQQHLTEEDTFIHPGLERRAPGSTGRLAQQHEMHRRSFARLEELIQGVSGARGDLAAAAGRHLYLAFTAFVADDLIHMFEEEQHTWPLMCSVFNDEELIQMEQSIAVNYGRDALLYLMPHLAGGASLGELAERLHALQTALPAVDYDAIAEDAVRPALDADSAACLRERGLLR